MKKKILSILLNPYLISAFMALVIILVLPDYFTKYKAKLVYKNTNSVFDKIYCEDLDGDGVSEIIKTRNNTSGFASYEVFDDQDNLIDQWNFGEAYTENIERIYFFDFDRNGYKEFYFVTKNNDSTFLNINEPISNRAFETKRIFIDKITPYQGVFYVWFASGMFVDLDNDGLEEFNFTLIAGFKGNPRNAYSYNLKTKELLKSPHLTNRSRIMDIVDINNDGFNELLFQNHSSGNTIDSVFTNRSDYSTWLYLLDHQLNFLFEPIEFKVPFSTMKSISIKNRNSFDLISGLFVRSKTFPNKLIKTSSKGKLIKEVEVGIGWQYFYENKNLEELLVYDRNSGEVSVFDYDLNYKRKFKIELLSNLISLDLDGDGTSEWIERFEGGAYFNIYKNNFKHKINVPIQHSLKRAMYRFSIKYDSNKKPQLFVENGSNFFVFDYSKNKWYYLQYLVYLGIYLGVYLIVWLIIKGQKIRSEKQRAVEKEIAELQIKTVKNQVDPHFVFNAINTISAMMLTDNKLEADNFICKFSDFMRLTLQQSDKISNTLKEELTYTENFIQLQQIRYSNKFDYEIKTDGNTNLNLRVPKHVLFSYVENAIKHGLSNKTEKGVLKINVKNTKTSIILEIEDNGKGLGQEKRPRKDSTGNGLLIMKKIYYLYAKLYKRKIYHKLHDIYTSEYQKAGLKVEIVIEK